MISFKSPIVVGTAAKRYLLDLASLCQEAAATDDPVVFESIVRLFETVPNELRRLRSELQSGGANDGGRKN